MLSIYKNIFEYIFGLSVLKMNRKIALSNLKNKINILPENATVNGAIKKEKDIKATANDESPYFSPRKTRNQRRHIKIETEPDEKVPNFLSKFVAGTAIKLPGSANTVSASVVPDLETKTLPKNEQVKVKVEPDVILKKTINRKHKADSGFGAEIKKEVSVKQEIGVKKEADIDKKSENVNDAVKQSKWEPKNWEQILNNIRKMRETCPAPVDTMGCDKCYDEKADAKTQRFHHLVALMLSAQTKDNVTYNAMQRLKKNELTPQTICQMDTQKLEQLIYPVSFYKNKAKYIKKTAQILIDQYDSDIPNSAEGLMKLPGVGPKMAHLCMKSAWDTISGIGVDTHVHRISNRFKWLPKETKEPEQTRIALEKWLPFELWFEVNELLVGFGQTICTPTNPKCGSCLNYDICPSKVVKKKTK